MERVNKFVSSSSDCRVTVDDPTSYKYFVTGLASVFASVWGKTLWASRLNLTAAYHSSLKINRRLIKNWKNTFLHSKRCGLAVFSILMFDIASSKVIQTSSPMVAEAFPFLENREYFLTRGVTSLATLIAIQRYRFVFLPLVLAAYLFHQDLFVNTPLDIRPHFPSIRFPEQ